jgi:hypothetical protein
MRTLTVHAEVVLGLCVGLALALIVRNASLAATGGGRGLDGGRIGSQTLLVRFTVYPERPPTIEEVGVIPEGRLTAFTPGGNHLRIEAADGAILFEQAFATSFFLTTQPPEPVDRLEFSVVVPRPERGHRVVVVTPQGQVDREIGR